MLVLSRRQGERILIGPDIVVTVVRNGDVVRLGIDAPKHIVVLRPDAVKKTREVQSDKVS